MIAFVEGTVRLVRKASVVVDLGGIGYEVHTPRPETVPRGKPVFFYTHQDIREDAHVLYGFLAEADLQVFLSLLNVKGIGPKSALNILRTASAGSILEAVEKGDVKQLKSLPGIGPKTASQMVLDLKGKLVQPVREEKQEISDPVWAETREALLSLGYRETDLKDLESQLTGQGHTVDQMLRAALNLLARRKGV